MRRVLYLVFLTFTVVQGHQVVHKRGNTFSKEKKVPKSISTDAALSNLMTKTVPIPANKDYGFTLISPSCAYDMIQQCKQTTEKVFHCDLSQKTCYVIGTPITFVVYVCSKTESGAHKEIVGLIPPGSKENANLPKYQAVILPFVPNHDTYTILDPMRQFNGAPWFFTAKLTGCDMFVATVENQGNKPLVVHSNRNEEPDVVKNLQSKEKSVDLLLKNENTAYNVIARVYWTSTDQAEKETINQHLSKYAATPGHEKIILIPYDESSEEVGFYFFGHYDGSSWTFVLKGASTGEIAKFSVSPLGTVVKAH